MAKKVVAKKPKAQKVARTRNAQTLTDSEYFGKIRSGLRKAFQYWKPMMITLKNASRPSQNLANKRLKTEYQCNHCKEWFMEKEIQIDHIVDAGTLTCSNDLPGFVDRLFCEVEGFQTLCKPCHQVKTNLAHKKIKENI